MDFSSSHLAGSSVDGGDTGCTKFYMRHYQSVGLVLLTLTLAACAVVTGVEPTDVSAVEEVAHRKEIEAKIRKPYATIATASGEVQVYQYNAGTGPSKTLPPARANAGLNYLTITLLLFNNKSAARQTGYLAILYGNDNRPDEFAIDTTPKDAAGLVTEQHRQKQFGKEYLADLRSRAETGDGYAQFLMYKSAKTIADKWKWLCLSANNGHPSAQTSFADERWEKQRVLDVVEPDPVQAYVWLTLAKNQDDYAAEEARGFLAREMSGSQVTEARRLAENWQPDSSVCHGVSRRSS